MTRLRGDVYSAPFLCVLIACASSQDASLPTPDSKCTPFESQCQSVGEIAPSRPCFAKHWRCDGENDCGNGFDEIDCRNSTDSFCNSTTFACEGGTRIPIGYVCDRDYDCPKSDDEHHCHFPMFRHPKEVTTMNLTVSTEVHLMCKSIGYPLPKIVWFHNGSLPSSHTTVNEECSASGRKYVRTSILVVHSVTPADSGSYMCEAMNALGRIISYSFILDVM